MSDALVLQEIRALRASVDARFLAHEKSSSDRMDRFEDRIMETFKDGADRMKGHSDRIRAIESASDTHVALPAVAAPVDESQPPKRMPWWLVAMLSGAAGLAGTQLWTLLIYALGKMNHP